MKKLILLIVSLLFIFNSYSQDFNTLLKAAKQGDAEAQFNVGLDYSNGEGVEKDYFKAFEWYLKAAEQGDAKAQNNVGGRYYNGNGVVKDNAKAYEWLMKAAEQRHQDAIEFINKNFK